MKNPSLLSLIPLLLLLIVMSLPASAAVRARRFRPRRWSSYSHVECIGDGRICSQVQCLGNGVYVANSTYQANLRRAAALLVADASAARGGGANYTSRSVGYWPNRLLASSFCKGTGASNSSCAACITGAFLKVQRACPYHREAYFSSRNCTLHLTSSASLGLLTTSSKKQALLKQALASGLIFQGIGFAWLFFLLLQEWRSRKRGTLMHPTPPSAD